MDEFAVLCKIVSWATCGDRSKDDAKSQREDLSDKQHGDGDPNRFSELLSERELIGRKAKTLLNWGRLVFLQSIGFQAELLYYVSIDVSLENMCIVATRE
jgi:tRNA:m4X modification enzyme